MCFRVLLIFLVFSVNTICSQTNLPAFPFSFKGSQSDSYFGTSINDPYRWLEEQESDSTIKWINSQNAFTDNYLDGLQGKYSLRESITKNCQIYFSNPTKKGKYFFILQPKVNGKEISIYYKRTLTDKVWEELFVSKGFDVDKGEYVSIDKYEVSKDSKYLAYTYDKNGSDWKELRVVDLEKMKNLDDYLTDIKHSSIVWRGNGFYYTKYNRREGVNQYKDQAVNAMLYYHKIGTKQSEDSLIFKKGSNSNYLFNPVVSASERYLIIEELDPIRNTLMYYYYDFESKSQTSFLPLFKKTNRRHSYLGENNGKLLFLVFVNNEKKVIALDPASPLKWTEKIKRIENLIVEDSYYHNNKIYQICFFNQQEFIVVFDEEGNIIQKVEIPVGHSVEFEGIDEQSNQLLISYSSYFHPPVFAGMDLDKFKFRILEHIYVNYEMSDYTIEKVMCKSDTAYVPMILMYKKGIKLDGNNPVLLEFYGGFGNIHKPGFDAGRITFIENGGVYAFAMIRGGGEKGAYWHLDGVLGKRQKSVDDVANCAKFLVDKKYTNHSKIAITGGSHGGFMAALAALKYPDLFKAAVPKVGVFDLLRFENFTIGTFHTDEYGSVKDSTMFKYMLVNSPLHNVKSGQQYPSFLFMTSNYDDRVPPLHSYKMVATLQENAPKNSVVLLRVEKYSGHNGAKGFKKYIDETFDFYSFIFNSLEVGKNK